MTAANILRIKEMNLKRSFRLPNRFDSSYHTSFNKQCDELLNANDEVDIELDFSQVQHLDSSAVGMLVLLAKRIVTRKSWSLRGRTVLL